MSRERPKFVRIRFDGLKVVEGPLDRSTRLQLAFARSRLGHAVSRRMQALRPGSRVRRFAFRSAVMLSLKSIVARDRRGLECFYEPDAELTVPPWPGQAEHYVGASGFIDFFEGWTENWDLIEFEMVELIDLGETTVALGWMYTRGGASGVATRQPFASFQTYGAGRIAKGEWFLSWEEGMAAAGLEGEPPPE